MRRPCRDAAEVFSRPAGPDPPTPFLEPDACAARSPRTASALCMWPLRLLRSCRHEPGRRLAAPRSVRRACSTEAVAGCRPSRRSASSGMLNQPWRNTVTRLPVANCRATDSMPYVPPPGTTATECDAVDPLQRGRDVAHHGLNMPPVMWFKRACRSRGSGALAKSRRRIDGRDGAISAHPASSARRKLRGGSPIRYQLFAVNGERARQSRAVPAVPRPSSTGPSGSARRPVPTEPACRRRLAAGSSCSRSSGSSRAPHSRVAPLLVSRISICSPSPYLRDGERHVDVARRLRAAAEANGFGSNAGSVTGTSGEKTGASQPSHRRLAGALGMPARRARGPCSSSLDSGDGPAGVATSASPRARRCAFARAAAGAPLRTHRRSNERG